MGSSPPADRKPVTITINIVDYHIQYSNSICFSQAKFQGKFQGQNSYSHNTIPFKFNPTRVHYVNDIPRIYTITPVIYISKFKMPREYHAHEIFCVNAEFRVLICQKCQYAVCLGYIESHLHGTAHRIPAIQARHIEQIVQQWDHIDNEPEVDIQPHQID